MALQALENWQKAAHQPVTGKIQVGSAQWALLKREATANRLPAGLSNGVVQRTLGSPTGYAIDGSQGSRLPNCVRVLQADPASPHGVKIIISTQAAYAGWAKGRDGKMHLYHTPDGVFALYYPDPLKDKAYSAEFFHAAMPWAIYFNGGVAFHYDGLFPSHGCVHIPSMALAKQIYYLPLKTPVVIHE